MKKAIGLAAAAAGLLWLAAGAALSGPVATPPAQGRDDAEFARLVREWTTRPEFLSPLVDHLPKGEGVPSPRDILGYHIGRPKTLTSYGDILKYFRALDAASPRVKMIPIGRSDEGRDFVAVFIGSEESIAGLERNRRDLARLADPRTLTEAEAGEIAARAKPVYHFIGGLHANEPAAPEMLMELAFRLATENSPLIAAIREKVIVALTPAADPDGRDRFVQWHYAHKIEETEESVSYGDPPFWSKYVRHDNNRDINYSQPGSRAVLDFYLAWHPQIVHDLHETVAFMFTFSGQAPQDPNLDPILYAEMPWFANFEMAQMAKYGMPGVWTHAYADMWYPGFLMRLAANHNSIMRLFETFSHYGANTMKLQVGPGSGGASRTSREWYRPWPAYPEVEWSLRNNINYCETGALTALHLTAAFSQALLDNFYRKSRNAIEAGRKSAPYAYAVPAGQPDPTRIAFLLDILRRQGIEAGRTTAAAAFGEVVLPAGSYLIKLDQPYGRLAKILLEKQVFPADPDLRSIDDTGWTMGLAVQAEVKEISDPAVLDLPTTPVDAAAVKGTVSGAGGTRLAVADRGSVHMIALRYRLKKMKIEAAERPFSAAGLNFPAGSFLIEILGGPSAEAEAKKAVEDLGLSGAWMEGNPGVPVHEVDLPRMAVYSIWGNSGEVGWVRHALDTFGVEYDLIFKEQARAGNLRAKYDLIVMPSQERSGKGLVQDLLPIGRPLAYRKSDRFPSLGMYGESDDITGGMGLEGVLEFDRFVKAGGVLAALGNAGYFPVEYGLVRGVEISRPSARFYAPGPIVAAEIVRPSSPVFYGYPAAGVPVRYAGGPWFRLSGTETENGTRVLMRFVGGDESVLSGLARGADELRGRPAIVETASGAGRVLMFATNPCFRFQNLGEFNMLFNVILHYNDIQRMPS